MLDHLRVLIVEDEVLIAETIKDYFIELGVVDIKLCFNKIDALILLETNQFDFITLDIRMHGMMDGIELGEKLSKLKIPFSYISANSDIETAKKMLSTDVLSFISKPIKKNEFKVNVSLILRSLNKKTNVIVQILDGNNLIDVNLENLMYIKAEGNYLEFFFEDSKTKIFRNTLENVLINLNSFDFQRSHRSYIVNKKYIKSANSSLVFLTNNLSLPGSRNYKLNLS